MPEDDVLNIHEKVMEELRAERVREWTTHEAARTGPGIYSSQISALVMLLVKKGILRADAS